MEFYIYSIKNSEKWKTAICRVKWVKNMKIIYVGKNIYGQYAFKQAAATLSAEYEDFFGSNEDDDSRDMEETINALLLKSADYYVIDPDAFSEPEQKIVENTYKLKEATNSKIVIHAPFYNTESRILLDLKAAGVAGIITTAENQGEIIDFFNNVVLEDEVISEEEQEEIIFEREETLQLLEDEIPQLRKITEEREMNERVEKKIQKIAVVGSKRGIGTTTAALQLVKYLNDKHAESAIYVEMNDLHYVDALENYYNCESADPDAAVCKLGGVLLSKDIKKLDRLEYKYPYYIYDYGSIQDNGDPVSLYEKDIIFLVGGIKANEIKDTTDAIDRLYTKQNVLYIMNFISERSRENALDFMEDKAKKTYFMDIARDPFVLSAKNKEIFEAAFVELNKEKPDGIKFKKSKLRRIFR